MKYWLVKSEPEEYNLEDLINDKTGTWDGVRNYQARNFMRQMKINDLVFIYYSGKNSRIAGLAKVVSPPFPDPTDETGKWSAIHMEFVDKFRHQPTLKTLKQEPVFQDSFLVRNSRLSVMPVSQEEADVIYSLMLK
ncbi:EVE domain-containing protein [Membranihabitans maritimus]|uniref:EVE domain-containing protein n=1 Tax=Membranihabitans maritimus TaxID=2904244 RepID=UPI001F30B292|nr:EVE domain-containing protein [Membranihabitans maritimus]